MEIRPILSALLRSKTGAILVALQVAISLAILANALHIVNVRQAVANRPSGIADESAVFFMQVRHLAKQTHNEQLASQKAELAALRAVGGVSSAAFTNQVPMSRSGNTTGVTANRDQRGNETDASFYFSPESLVKTWGLKLVEGRDFTPDEYLELDESAAGAHDFPKVAIVSRALGAKLWPDAASLVGKTLYFGSGEDANGTRIVGVVQTLQSQGAEVNERGEYSTIVPMRLTNGYGTIYTVRAEPGQRDRVMKEAEAALRAVSATPVILRLKSIDETRQERYRADTALAWMLITVTVLLLLITASGIVGMASLWVT
ncbi:MAG: transporter permease, partial [Massilia sp.]|nr:transporter permease [Massilia sp.]